jgi:hypothetical protein
MCIKCTMTDERSSTHRLLIRVNIALPMKIALLFGNALEADCNLLHILLAENARMIAVSIVVIVGNLLLLLERRILATELERFELLATLGGDGLLHGFKLRDL